MKVNLTAMETRRWHGDPHRLTTDPAGLTALIHRVCRPVYVVDLDGRPAAASECALICGRDAAIDLNTGLPLLGFAPALHPDRMGDASFRKDLGLRYAYIVGAMANGITSTEMIAAAGEAGMVGFFGAGGLTPERIDAAIGRLRDFSGRFAYGFNLIHSPNDPQLEAATVDLYLKRGIRLVSASAYLNLTLPLVYYRVKGIHQAPDGTIICPNRVVAKVSRIEVARRFFAPPPRNLLDQLLREARITANEAELACHMPVAQDMTAEADSGGHTDNRPALTLLPIFLAHRDQAQARYGYPVPLRVGLGGGIATPAAAAAAFAMGAGWILTGSINQACIEADTSAAVRGLLVQADQADVTMAPAADMFEMGAKVQVLKRGTMFAMRAARLYELYRTYDCYEQIPGETRAMIERDLLQAPFEEAFRRTRDYFETRDPSQIIRAQQDPRHKMALVFRSYLGLSSQWAKAGDPSRQMDYQIWCGPAMGAFNAWARGSFLEVPERRRTAEVAMNLLYGAAVLNRCHWLRCQGVCLPASAAAVRPLEMDEIARRLDDHK